MIHNDQFASQEKRGVTSGDLESVRGARRPASSDIDLRGSQNPFLKVLDMFSLGRTTVLISRGFSSPCLPDRDIVLNEGRIFEPRKHDGILWQTARFSEPWALARS